MKIVRYIFLLIFLSGYHSVTAQYYVNAIAGFDTCAYLGNGGSALLAALKYPEGICRDKAGNLYIADDESYVRKINAATGIITTIAGGGAFSVTGDNIPATSASIADASGLCIDTAGNLLIADSWSRVRKVNLTTGIITTVAGTLTKAYSGDGGSATAATLEDPRDVKVDTANNIYIADADAHSIRKVNAATGIITTIAGDGTCAYHGDGGLAIAAEMCGPQGLSVDKQGNIYISDFVNNRIRKITVATGIITTIAGTGVSGFSGDGGPATAAEINRIFRIALDDTGNLYIADIGNARIRKINAANGIINTIAGNGGKVAVGIDTIGNGGPATSAQMAPFDLCFDTCGNIFFTDYGCAVRVVTPTKIPYNEDCDMKSLGTSPQTSPRPSPKEREVVTVFPNPNTGTFTVNISSVNEEQAQIVITNMMGQKVKEIIAMTNTMVPIAIGMEQLAGIYFLSVATAHGNWSEKVIVRPER